MNHKVMLDYHTTGKVATIIEDLEAMNLEEWREKGVRVKREEEFLEELKDLFPKDVPTVSDEAEENGDFINGSFPKQMQDESSAV